MCQNSSDNLLGFYLIWFFWLWNEWKKYEYFIYKLMMEYIRMIDSCYRATYVAVIIRYRHNLCRNSNWFSCNDTFILQLTNCYIYTVAYIGACRVSMPHVDRYSVKWLCALSLLFFDWSGAHYVHLWIFLISRDKKNRNFTSEFETIWINLWMMVNSIHSLIRSWYSIIKIICCYRHCCKQWRDRAFVLKKKK